METPIDLVGRADPSQLLSFFVTTEFEGSLGNTIPPTIADSLAADPWKPLELAVLYHAVTANGSKVGGVLETVKPLLFPGYRPRGVSLDVVRGVRMVHDFVLQRQEGLGVEPYSLSGQVMAGWVGRYYNLQRREYLR